mgnify:CR=1 FL=1
MKHGFDNEKYLRIQSERIKERIAQFGDKLYLEFGGKLFDDNHASRVLPGFQPDSKLQMLMQLRDYAEILFVISALDIEKNKVRGDLGITYDEDILDEINRAAPKTQSSMLEVMQEHKVTVGNDTYKLAEPFFVLATENPIEQDGT